MLDHLRRNLEVGNLRNHLRDQVGVLNRLVRLHDLYDVSLSDLLAFLCDAALRLLILLGFLSSLLLFRCLWYNIESQLRVLESQIDLDFLGRLEIWFVYFFLEQLHLWLAKTEQSCNKIFLRNVSLLLNLLKCKHWKLVQKHTDRCLEHVHNNLMVLVAHKQGLQFNGSHLPYPVQVAVLVLVFVKQSKLVGTLLHRRRNVAGYRSVHWPGAISQDFGLERNACN